MKTAELKVIIDKHTTSLADFEAIWGAVNKYMQSHPSPMSVEQVEELGYYYPLFKFFSDEHGLSLLDSQLQDVIHECKKFIEPASPSVKADGWVIPDNVTLKDIKAVRDYFGEHDKSPFEHRAFDVMNKLVDYFTPHQNNNYKQ